MSRIEKTEKTNGFVSESIYVSPKSTGNYNLNIGIGSKTLPATGNVQFDNISLIAVNDAPAGTIIYDIGPGTKITTNQTTDGIVYVTVLAVLSILISIVIYIFIRKLMSKQDIDIENKLFKKDNLVKKILTSPIFLLTSAIIIGFVIRLVLANFISGFTKEISLFSNYASSLVSSKNPTTFYEKYTSTSLQSGVLYLLWFIGYVSKWLGINYGTLGFYILMKIPAIVADLIMIFVVYDIANRYFHKICSFLFALLYAVMPIIFTLSSVWGSFLPLMSLFVVLSMLSFIDRKPIKSIIFIILALIIDTSAIYVLPILLGGFVIQSISFKKIRLPFIITTVSAFIFLFLISLPFTFNYVADGKVFYFINKIIDGMNNYGYYTVNNLNFFALLSKNVITVNKASQIFNIILMVIVYLILIYMYYRNNNRLEMLLYSSFALIIYSVFGLYTHPYFTICGLTVMFLYMLLSSDRRIYVLFSLLSFTTFINLAQLMNNSGYIGSGSSAKYTTFVNGSAFTIIFSIINILLAFYYCFIIYRIGIENDLDEIQPYADSIPVLINRKLERIKGLFNFKKTAKKSRRIK
jgi:hypothetical protein